MFVVGYLGDWRPMQPTIGLRRHSPAGHGAPSREEGERLPTQQPAISMGAGNERVECVIGCLITVSSTLPARDNEKPLEISGLIR